MSKVVLDITMPLNGFIAGMENETDPLHNWTYGGEAGDDSHLTDGGTHLIDDASKTAKTIIYYQSKHIGVEVVHINESPSVIHLRLGALNKNEKTR